MLGISIRHEDIELSVEDEERMPANVSIKARSSAQHELTPQLYAANGAMLARLHLRNLAAVSESWRFYKKFCPSSKVLSLPDAVGRLRSRL